MQSTAQRFAVPAGFSGWWCYRKCGAVEIDDTLGSPARCPKCHKPTAVWIPALAGGELTAPPTAPATKRERAGEARALSAGAPWERKMPTAADAKRLFDHARQVIEQPDLEPDLRKLEDEQAKS